MLQNLKNFLRKVSGRFKLPAQIPMKYKKNKDGSFTYHVNRCKDAVYIWERCKAGTADWTVILKDSVNEFTTAPGSIEEKGDKYRCLIMVGGKVLYYSKVMTIGNSKYRSSDDKDTDKDNNKKTDANGRRDDDTSKEKDNFGENDNAKSRNTSKENDNAKGHDDSKEQKSSKGQDSSKEQNDSREQDNIKEQETAIDFFKGCSSWEQVRERYKKLMQAYHPDYDSGDEEYTKKINEQYTKLKDQYNK